MKEREERKNQLILNLLKIAKFCKKKVSEINRAEYREMTKELKLKGVGDGDFATAKSEALIISENSEKAKALEVSLEENKRQKKEEEESKKQEREEKEKQDSRKKILLDLYNYIKRANNIPSFNKMSQITSIDAKKFFGNIDEVEEELYKVFPDIKSHLLNESFIDNKYKEELKEKIKRYNKFIITTAVSDKPVDIDFVSSLKTYAYNNDALILVLPCIDASSNFSKYQWNLDPILKDFGIVFEDIYLNNNFYISAIKTTARQINSTTGLDRLPQKKNASIVFAATKQFLKFIPARKMECPKALTTTGAVTVGDYANDKYMNHRLSVIAENDHQLGALIVEKENNRIFHFRHVQASKKDKSISDLGYEYYSNGDIKKAEGTIMVLGDSHVEMHNKELFPTILDTINSVGVDSVVIHDCFNMTYGSHHDVGKICIQAKKYLNGKSQIENEGKKLIEYLKELDAHVKNMYIVKSNHDRHLDRYLTEGRFIKDPINFYFSLDLAKKVVEGEDPLKYMIEEKLKYKNNKIKWLELDESMVKYGNELGCHGDLGANGGKGSPRTFENAYGDCVVGHTHTAFLYRNVMGVGMTCNPDMEYNHGLSSWTYSCALVYSNGTKQHIHYIKDKNKFKYKNKRNK